MAEQNYLPKIGVDEAHWAPLLTDTRPSGDTPGATTYGAVKAIPGLVNVAFAANSQTGNYWADNYAYASAAKLGDMSLQVQCADLPPADRAVWLGQSYDEATGLLLESQINPINMAFGYRIEKSNNAHRYFWFFKCKPAAPDESAATATNSIAFRDGTVPMASIMRVSDGMWRRVLDSDDPALPEGVTPAVIAENWFTDPNWVVAAPTEP